MTWTVRRNRRRRRAAPRCRSARVRAQQALRPDPGSGRRRASLRRQGLRQVPRGERRRRQGRAGPRRASRVRARFFDLAAAMWNHLPRMDRADEAARYHATRSSTPGRRATSSPSSSRSTTSTRPATPRWAGGSSPKSAASSATRSAARGAWWARTSTSSSSSARRSSSPRRCGTTAPGWPRR